MEILSRKKIWQDKNPAIIAIIIMTKITVVSVCVCNGRSAEAVEPRLESPHC